MITSTSPDTPRHLGARLFLLCLLVLTPRYYSHAQGNVWAWGDNTIGELGNGTLSGTPLTYGSFGSFECIATPAQVVGATGSGALSNITAVSASHGALPAGSYFGLALDAGGSVWAWGGNEYGQLGNGSLTGSLIPARVVGPAGSGTLSDIMAVSAGSGFSLALNKSGNVWAWGTNADGQLGVGSLTPAQSTVPVEVVGSAGSGALSNITAISAGYAHSLALDKSGNVWDWGYGYPVGGAGNPTPARVTALTNIVAVAAGGDMSEPGGFSLALAGNGTVWAWGDNDGGPLGNGTYNSSSTPVQVVSSTGAGALSNITAIAAGGDFSMALDTNGHVWAWGYNSTGEDGSGSFGGDGDEDALSVPTEVVGLGGSGVLSNIAAISAGGAFATAVDKSGNVWAWGINGLGELGDGTFGGMPVSENGVNFNCSPTPVRAVGPNGTGALSGITAISAGEDFCLTIGTAGDPDYRLLWQDSQTGDTYEWVMNQAIRIVGADILEGVPTAWKIAGSGAFSGHANPDILWQNETTGEVGIWTMTGATRLGYTQVEPPNVIGAGWQIVGVADFNQDGHPDILWQNTSTGEIGYWQMSGTALVRYVRIERPGIVTSDWKIVGAPDFLGGLRPQILWQNSSTGEIGYWAYNPGTATWGGYAQIEPPNIVSTSWHIAATPDINGDGEADIVWQNQSTGEIGYWLMSKGQRQSYTQIAAPGLVSPTVWQLRASF